MASHIWDVKTFRPGTVEEGVAAYRYALARRAAPTLAMCFAGYLSETVRQAGLGRNGTSAEAIEATWSNAARRGSHRYTRGRNAANYVTAGRRLLCAALRPLLPAPPAEPVAGLYTALYDGALPADETNYDTLVAMLADALAEAGLDAAAALLRGE